MEPRVHIAAIRFGLGPRLGEALASDPLRWLDAQLAAPDEPPVPAGYATPPMPVDAILAFRADRDADAQAANASAPAPPQPRDRAATRLFVAEAKAQVARWITTPMPFRERLVAFWANHFTCSRRVGQVGPMMGAYLRDAIRPHVTGSFGDMLLAVVRHPAMLIYLDNVASVGPDSVAGRRSGRGLNENLAREILELHTLSPAAGYSQADVTEFAKIITGWSTGPAQPGGVPDGRFRFRPIAHQPGPKTLLGRRFEEGEEAGVEALAFLAAHPATHTHLATKLARHFVADDPPPAVVARLAGVLRDTKGDLGAVASALPRQPEAWAPLTKLRQPWEFVVAMGRAAGFGEAAAEPALALMSSLSQAVWTAPGPNGWPDVAADWATPEALMRRADLAWQVSGRAATQGEGAALAALEAGLGPLAKPATRQAVLRAGSLREAQTLIWASPEFQRR
jgi:uncharacterized protein (DUF1800 family)